MEIFALRDRKTAFSVFVKDAVNIEEFERWFVQSMLIDAKTIFGTFPEDYDIYKICDFDRDSMVVSTIKSPELICSVSDLYDKYHLTRPSFARDSDEA